MRQGKQGFRQIRTPYGLLFFDRQSGIHILIDELEGRWGWEKPLYVQFQITGNCNRQCTFCHVSSGPDDDRGIWDYKSALSLCHSLDSFGILGVAFGGGEPFLFPYFVELCNEVWETTHLDLGVTSNGLLIRDSDLVALRDHLSQLRVSVWNPVDADKLKRLVGNGVDVGVNLLMQRGGVKLMKATLSRCYSLGVRDFLILPCRPAGRATANMSPTRSELREIPKLLEAFRDVTVAFDIHTGLLLQSDKGLSFMQPWQEEGAGTRVVAVTCDGLVKPTSFCSFGIPLHAANDFPSVYARLVTAHANSTCDCKKGYA